MICALSRLFGKMDVNFEIEKLDSLIEQLLTSKLFQNYNLVDIIIYKISLLTKNLSTSKFGGEVSAETYRDTNDCNSEQN